MDLHDVEHNARDGLHVASLGGAWIAFVAGFGGMRDHGEHLEFAPRLPDNLTRMTFGIVYRGQCLEVTVTTREATYALRRGNGPLTIAHHGETLTLTAGQRLVRAIPAVPAREPPTQPVGREPERRSPG
jgi:alpha,alpha-trehalose phosphorylase